MPDITMCLGAGCPLKMSCYRNRARPGRQQPMSDFTPLIEGGKCPRYWPLLAIEAAALAHGAVAGDMPA